MLTLFSLPSDAPRRSASPNRFLAIVAVGVLTLSSGAGADPFPPNWQNGSGAAVHFQPVPWPANDGDGSLEFGDWVPYTMIGNDIEDNKTQDPSNGGTSPQNYVNVSSGCTDLTLPSIFVYFDDANEVLMFRWRVEQIAHTYAVGPNTQPAAAVDPWKSAQWTVLIDTDADGFRDFALLVDGSSGTAGAEVDRMFAIYSDTLNQSIDYVNDADVHLLVHNPTAFTDGPAPFGNGTGNILNFRNSLSPTSVWANGAGETLWDYGTTRARLIDQGSCIEYFVDYQFPLAALDATAVGGEEVTADTPLCLLFSTANSLNNPLQKDVVLNCDPNAGCSYCADPEEEAPFGDCFTPSDFVPGEDLGTVEQPIVSAITATGCSPTLTALVSDATEPVACGSPLDSSVASVDFYYYRDTNANGLADDGNSWTFAAAGTEIDVGTWRASAGTWDTTILRTGAYLIGVRAVDDQGNVTWSHLSQAEVDAMFPGDFANPSPDPGVLYATFINSCGTSPSAVKSASASEVAVGDPVDFTITVNASLVDPLVVTGIDDLLPAGWTFDSTVGGTLTPSTVPTPGAGGTITWTFPSTVVPAGGSATLIFRAIAPNVQGTFSNTATVTATGESPLQTNPVEVAVGAPRLTIAKSADVLQQTPGNAITYTITYSNDSPVTVTGAVITDDLPLGVSFVSATGGGTHDGGSPGTVTWNVGTLAAGDGPFTVSFTVTVDNPYPAGAGVPLVNTATIDSDETDPTSDDAAVFINLPLKVQKSASSSVVAPGANVTFTLTYANTGSATAVNAVLTDTIPAGFTYQSAAPAPASAPPVGGTGTVTWNLGNLAPQATGSVTLTVQATSPFTGANPATNTTTLSATGLSPVSDDYDVGVTQACTAPTTFYMRNLTGDVGADGTQRLAITTPGAVASPGTATAPVLLGPSATNVLLARFYMDPPRSPGGSFAGNVVSTFYLEKDNGNKADFILELFDYDPATGTRVSLGTSTVASNGSPGILAGVFTIAPTGALQDGHRLLWEIRATNTSGGTKTVTVNLRFDAVASAAQGAARSDVCLTDIETVLNKQVSPLFVIATPAPLATLAYTLDFSNPGTSTITGATVTDTLPAGVTYVAGSTLLNGAAAPDPSISGRILTFQVNGNGNAAGQISGGNSGTLTFQVTVDYPPSATSAALVNDATLATNEAPDVSDAASTALLRPNVVVAKAADATLVQPGDTVTYTLQITNAGTAAAANLTVTDDFPDQAYFTYVAASCAVDVTNAPGTTTTNCSEAGGVLTLTADTLAAGETILVSFQMTVATLPAPPAGLTTYDNFATATNTTDPGTATSNTVTVSISTNPNLQLTKTSAPAAGPLAAGDTVTYTITVENAGTANAEDVLVTDPIPAFTAYQMGSITYDAAGQTDAADGDTGSFNAVAVATEWDIGTMVPGASHTMTFSVVLDSILPNGATAIDNTATASASNSATKQASADLTAEASPVWTFTKSAPATMARPLTTLNGNHSATTTVDVVDATLLSVNDYVEINGTDTRITAISGNTLTVSVAISGNGSDVNPVIPYVIRYRNTGTATATNVTVFDDLPAGTVFVDADNGGVHDGGTPGTVTWTIGSVEPGVGGSLRFWARPTSTGTFDNTATLASDEVADVEAMATTEIGVLRPAKVTTTPSVVNSGSGATATYVITVVNDSGATATNVSVTDTFEAGFSFDANVSITGGTRTTTTDPTAGDNPATWCCWSLPAGSTLTITFDAAIAANVGEGTYQNDVSTSSDNVGDLDFDFLATADEDVFVSFIGPNHVVLSRFEAALGGRGVEITWETAAEVQAGGFQLLRLEPGAGFVQVHAEDLLPGLQVPQGGVYRLVDAEAPAAGPLVYVLNEIQNDGFRWSYGPFVVDPANGAVLTPPASRKSAADDFVARPRRKARPAAIGGGPVSEPGDGLRIGVAQPGLHRVGADEIEAALGLAAGEGSALIRSGKLLLTIEDREAPWIAEGGGQATGLLFFGTGIDSRYTNERVYRLESARGTKMPNLSGAPRGAPAALATFRDTVREERDTRPVLLGPLADGAEFWFWDLFLAGHPTIGRKSYVLETPGAVAAGGDAEITAYLQGVSATGAGSHRVELYVNGTPVGGGSFRDFEAPALTFPFAASLLAPGANTVELVAVAEPGVAMSIVALDRFEIEYERDYVATGPAFLFAGEDHEQIAVDGFADPGILLFDVTDPADPHEIVGARVEPGPAGYRVRFSPPAPDGRYLAVTAAGVRPPSSIRTDHPSNLRDPSNFADYVVITHADLAPAAERLAAHRESQGLAAMVIDFVDLTDEFNGGQYDPEAIRTFLRYAAENWRRAPRYVALAGEGTFDYKDVLGFGTNLVPTVMAAASWGLFGSDNRLADLVGDDGVPEVAVGRIPAATPAELEAYVDKLIAYEIAGGGAWMDEVVLAADDPDATGRYDLESDFIATLLPGGSVVHKAYIGDLGAAGARAELLSRLRDGAGLVSWVGHAGLNLIAHEALLTTGDVASLANGERAPVVSALACHLGNFTIPNFPSLAEELVLHGGGGATAVWSAAGLSYNPNRVVLGRAFFRAISDRGVRVLGDAVLFALEEAAKDPRGRGRETLESQVLLGDPALILRIATTE